jgi:peroxiredoxin
MRSQVNYQPTTPADDPQGSSAPDEVTPPREGPSSGVRRDAIVIVVVILVIAGMLIAGKRLTKQQTPGANISGSNNNIKGKPAPNFQLVDLGGNSVRLADLRGKAVLLNFWATWCPPCKIEMPWFVELQKQYGPQGLQIVGVAMDEGNAHDAVAKFAKEMGLNYTVLLGNDKVADQYGGVDALPTTFYIGRDGKIVSRVYGLVSHKEIEENVRAALSQGPAVAQNASATAGAAR